MIFGLLFLNPILSYVADVTHNGFSGNYLEHYHVYFTRITDLSGYDGGFAIGHLWFIAVLIIISICSCGIIRLLPQSIFDKKRAVYSVVLTVAGILTFEMKFFGKPLLTYLCAYLLGYYLFSAEEFVQKLVRYKKIFISAFLISSIMNTALFVYVGRYELLNNICNYLSFVFGILTLICLGREYLNGANGFSRMCSRLSYPYYMIHLPVVVLCQYFVSLTGVGIISNFLLSLVFSSTVTIVLCLLADKNAVVGSLFGIKKNR